MTPYPVYVVELESEDRDEGSPAATPGAQVLVWRNASGATRQESGPPGWVKRDECASFPTCSPGMPVALMSGPRRRRKLTYGAEHHASSFRRVVIAEVWGTGARANPACRARKPREAAMRGQHRLVR